ncbi:MAG: DUF3604 domain-containing protein [Myxococcota bacterium]
MARFALIAVVVLAVFIGWLVWVGSGAAGDFWEEGVATEQTRDADLVSAGDGRQTQAAREIGVARPKQILFGDLHVHSTFSPDAFGMALPASAGSGAKPISHACDYARFCSALDFWSINDHAVGLTPWKWEQTVEAIRQCEDVSGGGDDADMVPFLGWEWTQMGSNPDNHYGHKNVVLRDLGEVPDRPIAAANIVAPDLTEAPPAILMGLAGLLRPGQPTFDTVKFMRDMLEYPDCPLGNPVREQEAGCRDSVKTPAELYSRLDDWGFTSIVIPHGTTWGAYTPQGSAWDKQLVGAMHDPKRQTLIEVFSGHGNSEEYRSWQEVAFGPDGEPRCPDPTKDFVPSCWRAGEIIAERCSDAGESEATCAERAAVARQNYAEADLAGHLTVPGSLPNDWLDSSQCTDCFQPSFNYRPKGSAQYIMALRNFDDPANPRRFEFGFMASSDNHTGRPGTGYKEYDRVEMTEARIDRAFHNIGFAAEIDEPATPESRAFDAATSEFPIFAQREQERGSSFFLTGGLIAVHSEGRGRAAVWDAMQRKEVYGTSGPRILLWFDLLNPPGSRGQTLAMGGEAKLPVAPIFQARAVGSFEQKPGCPADSVEALGEDTIAAMCGGECYHPSDRRRPITRIEVVRIRPQERPGEPIEKLVEDPWRVFACDGDPAGCTVTFADPEFAGSGRDALYYVRAIEAPSPAVGADPLGCERDDDGRCIAVSPCRDLDDSEDCLAETEERAWSSPIFIGHAPAAKPAEVAQR